MWNEEISVYHRKEEFVNKLSEMLNAMEVGIENAGLDDGGDTVTVKFWNDKKITVNIAGDSYWAIVQDVVKALKKHV